jgi:hypothetical protein
MALSDLTGQQLEKGFQTALRESKFWPRPAELREYCTGITAKGTDSQEASRLWAWAIKWASTLVAPREYLVTTPRPEPTTWEDHKSHFPSSMWADSWMETRYYADQQKELDEFSLTECVHTYGPPKSKKFYGHLRPGNGLVTVTVNIPPPIPETLKDVLIQVEGSVSRALDRIVAHLESGDDRHLRHNFEEAALNVMASRKTETYTSAARQLTGKVATDFEPRAGLFEVKGKKLVPISEEQARQLLADGTITDQDFDDHLWALANLDMFCKSEYTPKKGEDTSYDESGHF